MIFALGLFSALVVNLSNSVREEHYWHDLLAPYFKGLASAQMLVQAEILPSGLLVGDYVDTEHSERINKRLQAGQLVVELSDKFVKAKKLLPRSAMITSNDSAINAPLLFSIESERGGDQFYEFLAWFIQQSLESQLSQKEYKQGMGQEKFEQYADSLMTELGIELSMLTPDDSIQTAFLLEELARSGYAKVQANDVTLLYVSIHSGEVFKIILADTFSIVSFPVILFLAICGVFSVSLLAYSFVQSFDLRIRGIETAASRISRGELDARVTSAGEEDAISRLGLAFNSMADHIQRLMYVQKEMIHAVSHELRTPVARIRFGVQMIEDCQTPESVQKQVKGIDGDIQELDELIDEILTYARLEQGGPILAFQQADVAAIVEQVVQEQSADRPKVKITAEFKEGSKVWKESEIETRYIHRSIQNLVGNAKRYADSQVKVICSFDAETCRIDVEDDGPGIPEDQWESVFTPFARLDDSRTRSSGGYGLGLSIVRRILYWHGGQAFLGRSQMGGAKFSLVWPRKQSS